MDATTGLTVGTTSASGGDWRWRVPAGLPSSLYRAEFAEAAEPVYFVVRAQAPDRGGRMLVVVPFMTWQAYNRIGEPGAGLYLSEQPDRAFRVSFDRPGGGPAGFWEDRFYRWVRTAGYAADFCSDVDLHAATAGLAGYPLLVVAGHVEYWTWQMRDAVESFTAAGGNVAFLGGNTCWWQARLEDGGRTLVCYRDALADPVAATDPARTTVEWSAEPVSRPENSMTGVSFRAGGGCWQRQEVMAEVGYTARFAGHWVFAGTGLRDGDEFARGAVGYETDAAQFEEVAGVPLATGRDGGPRSLVILATADLTGWRDYGQGGHATMAIFQRGRGTVFNAATVNWGNRLDDPVVDRITRNVLDRLARPGTGEEWQPVGAAPDVRALTTGGERLFAATGDGTLLHREFHAQNLPWRPVLRGPRVVGLAGSREAHHDRPVELYGLAEDGWILSRPPVTGPAGWRRLCPAVPGAVAIAVVFQGIFVATADGLLWHAALADLAGRPGHVPAATGDQAGAGAEPGAEPDPDPGPVTWTPSGDAGGAVALAAMSGRLFAVDGEGRLRTRAGTVAPAPWTTLGAAGDAVALCAHAGRLVAGTADGRLVWRNVVAPGGG
ncbi:hypothetical protein Daura_15865 [Dactylosporangium aurantiacum]|uniref:N,N-dimethylformamidase beta subunit-like C-terminal domain-containing protein n=1 Tax=Dactylosporangium aurantiacum TaxID=35754 RepID=A0A9Q9IQH9_9ACTN|nr:N,N-dimethylformamidase beta subunit family domain-containing protein [Dactylosporangium aurantiacum]MDG6102981.1 hypothetical protein [Dactylosporangium aurantiacum]UWZ57495.1 hypothetical protein Daura_15865 [Dactylosporangium aurantiacum]